MSGLGTLLRKELKEQLRTHRLLVVGAIFLVLGLATPLLLKYMGQLLELAGDDVVIQVPEPTPVMAITEYADSVVQVGVLAAVLVGMGVVARERERGTAAMVLSKPVGIGAYVSAKLLAMSATFILALAAGSGVCYLYTSLLIGPASVPDFLGMNALVALFFIFCLALTLLCSSLLRNQLAAGGIALAVLVGQALLAQVPLVGDYVPGQLPGWGTALLSGPHPSHWAAVGVSLAIIAACLLASRQALRRRDL
jgi:ABC-2 type transport system permease protein